MGDLRRGVSDAEKARYLISLFAETSAAQDRRRQELIASVLSDLDRLTHKAPDDQPR